MTLRVSGKAADRLIQGTAMLDALPHAEALDLLGGVVALGATTFDLAHAYGAGASEARMGEWIALHGARDALFLITKGGHPVDGRDRIARAEVRSDLQASLDRLRTDVVDLYLLHRDAEAVPVDEIVGFLDDLCTEGLVRAWGVSNWRHERFAAARAYARRHSLREPVATSPHFSLAVPTRPPWPGCVSVAGDEGAAARAYYAREGIPVLAWSSLAMGYFALDDAGAPAGARTGREQTMSRDVFGSPENAARRERARALARAHGESPTQIAFRWALSQAMTVQPIVGCRTVEEYAMLRDAAQRPLAADEVRWLEHGGGAGFRVLRQARSGLK